MDTNYFTYMKYVLLSLLICLLGCNNIDRYRNETSDKLVCYMTNMKISHIKNENFSIVVNLKIYNNSDDTLLIPFQMKNEYDVLPNSPFIGILGKDSIYFKVRGGKMTIEPQNSIRLQILVLRYRPVESDYWFKCHINNMKLLYKYIKPQRYEHNEKINLRNSSISNYVNESLSFKRGKVHMINVDKHKYVKKLIIKRNKDFRFECFENRDITTPC